MESKNLICDPPYMINRDTGEVVDVCIEANDKSQDKELEHYSITPPVPYVPDKYKEKMKEYNTWLKGKEKFIELMQKLNKKLKYLKELEESREHEVQR